jgi:hypothetical protein
LNSSRARKVYYELNNIGWCARPASTYHKKKDPTGYLRKGQFKKASNMNHCLDFSIRVEDELQRLLTATAAERGIPEEAITVKEENVLYEKALQTIIDLDEGRTWASGNVRIGELILIIDSDTRVVSHSKFDKIYTIRRKVANFSTH